jgi:hypothetical protein
LALARTINPKFAEFNATLLQIGLEQKGKLKPDFKVESLRSEVYDRLQAAGVKIERAQYDAGVRFIDTYVISRVGRASFGDTLVTRRMMPENKQLLKAIDLLHKATTQKDVFAVAAIEAKTPGAQAKRGQQ